MRYGIFADVHGNNEAFQAVIDEYKKEGIDRFINVGDIVGYGADPAACLERIQDIQSISIAGNHDWAVGERFSAENFNPYAREAVEWTKQALSTEGKQLLSALPLIYSDDCLTCVHGTLEHPERFDYLLSSGEALKTFDRLKTPVCFVGHTHVPVFIEYEEGRVNIIDSEVLKMVRQRRYICNVGSVGQPRDGNPQASFCVMDTKKMLVELKRVKYNIQKAQEKIRKKGLPEFLAERLNHGR